MILFRNVEAKDLDAIYDLALQSGVVGITTLPKDKVLLKKRLAWAVSSFKKKIKAPTNEYYFFVLEDTSNGKIAGCSAIEAYTGSNAPFYSYKLLKRTRICHSLHIRSDYEVLTLVNDYQDSSELCTLFLNPDYRKNHYGLLLSRARLLFMAEFPYRFARKVIAEMRGVFDESGRSPFWDNLGGHFFKIPFAEADSLTIASNKQFIADLMPRNSIYVKLLAPEAQAVIGKPHPSTLPAMHILLHEGFHYHNYIDIFDAGPTLEAHLKNIRTVRNSRILTLTSLSDSVSSQPFLISNTGLNFKATLGEVLIDKDKNTAIISKETATILGLKEGDIIRIALLQEDE
jgi:arginine N-succinyltransferase